VLLHVGFGFASGVLATAVMGDYQRVEVRNVHEARHFRSPTFQVSDAATT